jgi:hypothetical protein
VQEDRAMQHVVFVPGIMGSELVAPDGTAVWPPTALETQFGYRRVHQLLRDDLRVGDIVRKVWCVGVYRPLIDTLRDIGFAEAGAAPRLHAHAYDWRRDLEELAAGLAARVAGIAAAGATDIVLVAHSMGGLVARLMLESGLHAATPGLDRVTALYTLGTPHLGAPLALARILGLDTALGVSGADFRRFAADRRWPSGYQLLPPPGEAPCWDVTANGRLAALDPYEPAVAARLGLDPVLLARAAWVHDTLRRGQRPAGVRYMQFAGGGHPTATRINVGTTDRRVTVSPDAGDGTVPLWSALPNAGQKQVVPGNHTDFFTHDAFKAVFYRLFGKSFALPPLSAAPVMALSVPDVVLLAARAIDLLLVPSMPVGRIAGRIVLSRTDDPDQPWQPFGEPVPVTYEGPPVASLAVRLAAVGRRGFYRIAFEGVPSVANPAMFAAVAETDGGGGGDGG